MTLLITFIAAFVATAVWYISEKARICRVSDLCYIYWGASVMWMTDAIFEYAELGTEYFNPSAEAMINDAFLGISAIALGLFVWLVILFKNDPMGVLKATR